ncbi:MAG: precorrin-8X methylmutase [Ardenticatenaceae bacterium]|nr:precorrin-8X methylmutase [Ardenticatenaceae bacterium]
MAPPTLLLVGHGSRDATGVAQFKAFAADVAGFLQASVVPCFLELADPPIVNALQTALRAGARHIVALPLFLGPAGHQKNDVPTMLNWAKQRWPDVRFDYGTPLGVHPYVVSALADRAREAMQRFNTNAPAAETAVLLMGRGSRDPDANSNVAKLARLLWEGGEYGWVESAFYSLTGPGIEEGVRRCATLGARRVVVLPHFLFDGVILNRTGERIEVLNAQLPAELLLADPMRNHPHILALVRDRMEEAIGGTALMTCDLCKYRHRMIGHEHDHGRPQTSDHSHGLRGIARDPGPGQAPIRLPESLAPGRRYRRRGESDTMIVHPSAITANSFHLVRRELGTRADRFTPDELSVVARVIHSTADFDFAETLAWSDGAIDAGVAALRRGAAVICDVSMVHTGISARRLAALGGTLYCFIADADVHAVARREGTTRALVAIRKAGPLLDGALLAIGNAPTALLEAIRMVREEERRPALIIGVPVGFVATAESKAELATHREVPWITCHGRKGGSPVAVAIVNALLRLAAGVPATEAD